VPGPVVTVAKFLGMRVLLLVVLLELLMQCAVFAAPFYQTSSLKDTVLAGHSETYADLLRRLMPDLRAEGSLYRASRVTHVRPLCADDEFSERPFSLQSVQHFALGDLRVVFCSGGGARSFLAAFRVSPSISLVDAVEIGQAGHIDLQAQVSRTLFTVSFWHDNSGESYDRTIVVGWVKERFKPVLSLPQGYGFVQSLGGAQVHSSISFKVAAVSPSHGEYPDLRITATSRVVCHPVQSEWNWQTGVLEHRVVTRTAVWDAGAYSDPFASRLSVLHLHGVVYGVCNGGLVICGDKVLRLRFNPNDRKRLNVDSLKCGTECDVRYMQDWDGDHLLSVTPSKKADRDVTAAVKLVGTFYQAMSGADYAAAYAHLSARWRRGESLDHFERSNANVEYPSVYEMTILRQAAGEMRLLALSREQWNRAVLAFRLVREDGAGWVIDEVRPTTVEELLRAYGEKVQ
jgi:hypothetical protein